MVTVVAMVAVAIAGAVEPTAVVTKAAAMEPAAMEAVVAAIEPMAATVEPIPVTRRSRDWQCEYHQNSYRSTNTSHLCLQLVARGFEPQRMPPLQQIAGGRQSFDRQQRSYKDG